MGRNYVLPDPDDRSKNEPSIIISAERVLGIYKQETADNNAQRVTQNVQDWFERYAKEAGWDEVNFVGSQCVLTNTRVSNT